jgi:HSP20 family molecular chaperone IbpA
MSETTMMVTVNAGDRPELGIYAITNPSHNGQVISVGQGPTYTGDSIRIGDPIPDEWVPGGPLRREFGGGYYPPYRIDPQPWIEPYNPYPYDPSNEYTFKTIINTTGFLSLSPWTIELTDDTIGLSCDMPGVKPDDMKVEIKDGTLTVTGVRRDKRNGANTLEARTTTHTWKVEMYVAESATAILLDGVLTVKMQKREEFKPKVVKVKVK